MESVLFWGLILGGMLVSWYQTNSHGLGVYTIGCVLLRLMEGTRVEEEMKAKDARIEDLNRDVSTLIRAVQSLKLRNESLERRLWNVESTYVRKVESAHRKLSHSARGQLFSRSCSALSADDL